MTANYWTEKVSRLTFANDPFHLPYARLSLLTNKIARFGKALTKNWPSIDQVLAKHWPRIDQGLINYWQVLTKQNNENQAKFYTLVDFESGI